jgi:hypothetical protein
LAKDNQAHVTEIHSHAHMDTYSCMQMFQVPTEAADRVNPFPMGPNVTCGAQVQSFDIDGLCSRERRPFTIADAEA